MDNIVLEKSMQAVRLDPSKYDASLMDALKTLYLQTEPPLLSEGRRKSARKSY